jgi:hypothetical protein
MSTEESEDLEPSEVPAWLKDESAFQKHFKIPYSDFGDLLLALPEDLQAKYEKTRRANAEAAILWAIHEGQSHGLLEIGSET